MNPYHKYVGLDVHKERNEVAIAEASGEVRLYGSSANCIHPSQPRGLTLREAARCQSFRDTYKFYGSGCDKRLLIGNAVPPMLAEVIGQALHLHLAQQE